MCLRKTIFLVLNLMLLLAALPVSAQPAARPSEYQLKAAFLYNFAKFIDWPAKSLPDGQSPFVMGILGDNPFGGDLEKIVAGKKINAHPVAVQFFHSADEATNCQILFISNSEKAHFPEIILGLRGKAVLTVGETDEFIATGGMVNFVLDSGKIRFQINDAAAKSNGLKISSKLLSLAITTTAKAQ